MGTKPATSAALDEKRRAVGSRSYTRAVRRPIVETLILSAVIALIVVGGSVGCGGSGGSSPSTSSVGMDHPGTKVQHPAALVGRSFQAIAVMHAGQPRPIVKQTPIGVFFGKHGRLIGWSGGCNAIGAKGTRITANQILVKGFVSTAAGCPGPEAEQEQWVNNFFESDPHWELTGNVRLELSSGDTVIELQEQPPGSGPKRSH
jgi:heat shock protein HslJ